MEYCIFPEDPEFHSSGTQDPYCAWDTREEVCRGSQTWSPDTQTTFLQVPNRPIKINCKAYKIFQSSDVDDA